MDIDMIKIMIVDDLERVRLGLRTTLELMGDLRIVGEAADGFEALRIVKELKPDIVLMDLEMPGIDGFMTTRLIKARHPNTGIIVLSIHSGKGIRQKAERVGADAFVEKGDGFSAISSTIRQVYEALSV